MLQVFRNQLESGVVPVMLESLLSTHGDELGMLEDMWFVIKNLECVSVQVIFLGILSLFSHFNFHSACYSYRGHS